MNNYIVSIEGNIGSGKSTIMNHLKIQNNRNFVFVDEPVNEWLSIKNKDNKNALELFYENKKENSFWFQILAYITRLKNLLNVLETNQNKIIICERSIYTDHYVFAEMLHECGFLNEMEWITYKYWFDTFKDKTKIDLIIYVNTLPNECLSRINKRNRTEEENKIPLKYLVDVYNKHEKWLNNFNTKIVKINGNNNLDNVFLDVDNYISNIDF